MTKGSPTITFRNLDRSPAIETAIHDRAELLYRMGGRIEQLQIVIEAANRTADDRVQGLTVRVEMAVPGPDIVVTRIRPRVSGPDDVVQVVRDAMDTARRQLAARLSQRRGGRERRIA